jgi:AraC-like DNA-binding protein
MRFGGIPFEWIERQAAGAVRRGAALDRLLSESLIDVRHGDNRDVVSPVQHLLFCLNSVVSGGDAAHALARRTMSQLSPDVGVRVFLGCADLENAIQALSRLYLAVNSPVHIQLRTEQDLAILSIHIEADDSGEGILLEEIFLVWLFQQVLRFLGRMPAATAVTLRDPLHFNIGARHWGIGAPVSHGGLTAVYFPRRLLAEGPSSPAGENVLWETHKLWIDHLRGAPPRGGLDRFVAGGEFVRFADIVRGAGVSPNTLRRRLQTSGGGFREARQRALVEAAIELLQATNASVDAIAAELGYSDDRSLRRFLKAATGMTPQQLRERGQMAAANANPQILQRIKSMGEAMAR